MQLYKFVGEAAFLNLYRVYSGFLFLPKKKLQYKLELHTRCKYQNKKHTNAFILFILTVNC